jgi:hypothetical protein
LTPFGLVHHFKAYSISVAILYVKIDVGSLGKDYDLPKWQNKTQRKVIKAEKHQLLYSVVIFVNFVSNFFF